jgi:alpha-beta hydrolase superfamily lysophospholipase
VGCHGIGRSKSDVVGQTAMLQRAGYHVAAFDMRKNGDNDRDRAYHSMASFTGDLAEVLGRCADIDGDKLAVSGFSFSTWPSS